MQLTEMENIFYGMKIYINMILAFEMDNPRGSLIGTEEKLNERILLYLDNKVKERNSINKELIFGGKFC